MARRRSDEAIAVAEFVSIGELSRLSQMRYSTLKHYTECGLLPFYQEDRNLTRRYQRQDSLARLEEIKQLKAKGQSIPEIIQQLANK